LNEFDFSKISLSLDRDLAVNENPLDGFRGIHALLSKALVELQIGPKKASSGAGTRSLPEPKTQQSPRVSDNHTAFTAVNKTKESSGVGTPLLTVETVQERLAKWLPDLEILDGFDGFAVKPKRFLGETWSELNSVIRALGGKWQKGLKPADGAWRIAK
jgi:hypothetical protein